MKLVYFAWIRQKIGLTEETVAPPAEIRNVGGLLDWLAARGPDFADALKDRDSVKVAVNQDYADPDHPIGPDDEIALFPPVTGG